MMTQTPDSYVAAAQAGMTTSGGLLDRPLLGSAGGAAVPNGEVRIENGHLCWSWAQGDDPFGAIGYARLERGAFEEFLVLGDAPDEEIADYAARWGPLWLCACGRPWEHPPIVQAKRYALGPCVGEQPPFNDPYIAHTSEPLEWWRTYSRRARALCEAAAAFHLNEEPAEGWGLLESKLYTEAAGAPYLESLAHLGSEPHGTPCRGEPSSPMRRCKAAAHECCNLCELPLCLGSRFGRFELGQIATEWLHLSGVGLKLWWDESTETDPELAPGSELGGLMPYLTMQLAMGIVRSDPMAFCAGCGTAFQPSRTPAPGRRPYCPLCRNKARWRNASKRYRDRQRSE
jgi:hypothetical protein